MRPQYGCSIILLFPFSLVEEILSFSQKLVQWLFVSLQDLPAPLGIRKVQSKFLLINRLRKPKSINKSIPTNVYTHTDLKGLPN